MTTAHPADFFAGCSNERDTDAMLWRFCCVCVRVGTRRAVRCIWADSSALAQYEPDIFLGCDVFHDMRRDTVCARCQHLSAADARFFAHFHVAWRYFMEADSGMLGAAFLEMDTQVQGSKRIFKKIVKNEKNPFLFACGGIE